MTKKELSQDELVAMSPVEMRSIIRQGEWTEPNEMACFGYWKANLAVVPKDYAFMFYRFAQHNPQCLAVTETTEPGDPHPRSLAQDADLRTDLPRYRVFEKGEIVDEPTDIIKYWRDDFVAFLIGFGGNFIPALLSADVRFRVLGAYNSDVPCVPCGPFKGTMALGISIYKSSADAVRAIQISSRYPHGHGAPVHIGDPTSIGVKDLSHPDIIPLIGVKHFSHPDMISLGYSQEPGEIIMCWGAGPTAQRVARASKIPFMITHHPAHLFISDRRVEDFAIF
jgi:uncharacterized protein YcsI (UPF0317 family)